MQLSDFFLYTPVLIPKRKCLRGSGRIAKRYSFNDNISTRCSNRLRCHVPTSLVRMLCRDVTGNNKVAVQSPSVWYGCSDVTSPVTTGRLFGTSQFGTDALSWRHRLQQGGCSALVSLVRMLCRDVTGYNRAAVRSLSVWYGCSDVTSSVTTGWLLAAGSVCYNFSDATSPVTGWLFGDSWYWANQANALITRHILQQCSRSELASIIQVELEMHGWILSTLDVATDALLLMHRAISINSAD